MRRREPGQASFCRAARRAALPLVLLALPASPAHAGWYLMPEVSWGAFAPRPAGSEATPNFYGYGLQLGTGYSMRQAFDVGLYGSYLPGTLRHAQIGKGDATLVSYGGGLGLRFADSVYLGFKGGATQYRLSKDSTDPDFAGELPGTWTGPMGGFALGAVSRVTKTAFIQTTVEVTHHLLANRNGTPGKRQMDTFSLGVAYMYNSKGDGSSAIESTIFKNFLDSIVFF